MTTTSKEPEGLTGRRICILHAEDDRFTSASISRLLTLKGFFVQSAANGLEALQKLLGKPESFDLIITDHSMPALSGVEWLTGIRETGFAGKILVFAGDIPGDVHGRFLRLGADRIVNKTSGPKALLDAVEELLSTPGGRKGGLHGLEN